MSIRNGEALGESRSQLSPARALAYECLEKTRKRNAFARNVLDGMLDDSGLSFQDKAFATRLVLGVVSTVGALDAVIDKSMRSPRDVKPNVRSALRISAYEILFLKKSSHVAVDQGVELVRYAAPKAANLGNAVLHKLAHQAKIFPFGDPDSDIRIAALEQGFPVWMASRMEEMHGAETARDMMRACNEDAPIFLAINSLKATAGEVEGVLNRLGAEFVPASIGGSPIEGCLWLSSGAKLHEDAIKRMLAQGKMLVSDAASQAVVLRACQEALAQSVRRAKDEGASPRGRRISALELCCGRGTKTILLQDRMNRLSGQSFSPFVAVDNVKYKVDVTSSRLKRFGVHADGVVCADASSPELASEVNAPDGGFDFVFVDAPCTGTGTLRRHPEIRWKISYDDVLQCARNGLSLLKSASALVAPGGVLAHSTCSMEPEEDELVVEGFLRSPEGAGFKAVSMGGGSGMHLPLHSGMGEQGHPSSDSHFLALFVRRS